MFEKDLIMIMFDVWWGGGGAKYVNKQSVECVEQWPCFQCLLSLSLWSRVHVDYAR